MLAVAGFAGLDFRVRNKRSKRKGHDLPDLPARRVADTRLVRRGSDAGAQNTETPPRVHLTTLTVTP
jgi:hypothetical protein